MNRFRSPLIWLGPIALVAAVAAFTWMGGSKTPPVAPEKPAVAATGVAAISPESAKAAGITTEVAGPAEIAETLTLYGSIKPNAEKEQELHARYAGVVRAVTKRVGDVVKKGETLLTVESNDSLQTYSIASPIDGKVLERNVNVGSTVSSETALMKVADLSTLWVEFAVFARDVARIHAGQKVRILGADGTTMLGEATIAYMAPAGHADSQSVTARAVLSNAEGKWVVGQFVAAEVVVEQTQAAVAVHPDAVQTLEGKQVVFVEGQQGFQARPITTGASSTSAVEVVQGLNAGERYAAANSYLIKADLLKAEEAEE